jgi:hypothetical protein
MSKEPFPSVHKIERSQVVLASPNEVKGLVNAEIVIYNIQCSCLDGLHIPSEHKNKEEISKASKIIPAVQALPAQQYREYAKTHKPVYFTPEFYLGKIPK